MQHGFDKVAVCEPGAVPDPPPKVTRATLATVAKRLWKISGTEPDRTTGKRLKELHRIHQAAVIQAGAVAGERYQPAPPAAAKASAFVAALESEAPLPVQASPEESRRQADAQVAGIVVACRQLCLEAAALARAEVARLIAAVEPKLAELEAAERAESEGIGLHYEASPALRLQRRVLSDLKQAIPPPAEIRGYGIRISDLCPWLD